MRTFECDLHSHTNRSDGNDSYEELIAAALRAGVRILAITDHDIAPLREVNGMPLVAYARAKGLTVLPGIEFSCDTRVEDVHIVGLGCDFSHPFFEQEHRRSINSKIDGYRQLCRLLGESGMPVDWDEDVLLGGRIQEQAVQRKMIFEAMARRGYVREWSEGKLLVKRDPRFEVKREKPDPLRVIEGIHQSGGIAILAHPYLIADPAELHGHSVSREAYIERLIGAGLDGIEASYPYSQTSYDGALSEEQIEREVRARYEGRLPIISGGSDYHNEGKKGSSNPRRLGEHGVSEAYFMANPRLCALLNA